MKTLGQPIYALCEFDRKERKHFIPRKIYGATDADALDAAKDFISSEREYVLVRLVADFAGGTQTAEYTKGGA